MNEIRRIDRVKKANRKKKKTRVKLVVLSILVIGASYLYFKDSNNDTSISKDIEAQNFLNYVHKKNGDISLSVPEKTYQKYLHEMTHEEVNSSFKIGSIESSKKNIKSMKIILRQNDFKYKEKYEKMLNNWEKENYENINNEHDFLWEKLGKPDSKSN